MGTESIEDEKGWLAYLNDDGFSWRFGRKLGDGNVLIDHPYWPLAFRMSESAATSALDPWFSSHEFTSADQIMLFFSGMALNSGERGQISVLDKRSGRAAWTSARDFDASGDESLAMLARSAQRMNLSEVASLTAKSYGFVYGALTIPAGNGAMAVDLLDAAVETGRSGWSARTTTTVGVIGAAVVLHMASSRSGRGAVGVAADEADDAWRARMRAGRGFDEARRAAYPFNELYVHNPAGGYFKVDSYNHELGEIVSRKSTQFAAIRESTGISYIRELARKYSPGTQIADVPTSGGLGGQKLKGRLILEVPAQTGPIPQAVLDAAVRYDVIIRDVNGRIYR